MPPPTRRTSSSSATQYALAYSRDDGIPKWVSWHLNASNLGTTPRSTEFFADTSLPIGWYQVQPTDYTRTGYNRGQMCPSEHRTLTMPDNMATFLMTDVLPQAPGNDEGPWELIENYTRDLAMQGMDLFLVCGYDGSLGTLNNLGKITIPANTWYVIVVWPSLVTSASQIDASARVIALRMPNTNAIKAQRWQDFLVTTASIEAITGYRFFGNLSPSVQAALKAKVDKGT